MYDLLLVFYTSHIVSFSWLPAEGNLVVLIVMDGILNKLV